MDTSNSNNSHDELKMDGKLAVVDMQDTHVAPSAKKQKLSEPENNANNSVGENGNGVDYSLEDRSDAGAVDDILDASLKPAPLDKCDDGGKTSAEETNSTSYKLTTETSLVEVPNIFKETFDLDFGLPGNVDDLFDYYEDLLDIVAESTEVGGTVKTTNQFASQGQGQLNDSKGIHLHKFYVPSDVSFEDLKNFDHLISEDIPERMHFRPIPVTSATTEEIKKEALWIYEELFAYSVDDRLRPRNNYNEDNDDNNSDDSGSYEYMSSNDSDGMGSDSDNDDDLPLLPPLHDIGLHDDDEPGEIQIPAAQGQVLENEIEPLDDDSLPPLNDDMDVGDELKDESIEIPGRAPVAENKPVSVSESPLSPKPAPDNQQPSTDSEDDKISYPDKLKRELYLPKLEKILELIRNDKMEIPFIYYYRRRCVDPTFRLDELWNIYEADSRYQIFIRRRNNLQILLQQLSLYESRVNPAQTSASSDKININPPTVSMQMLNEIDFESIHKIKTMEQLEALYVKCTVYYSESIAGMKTEAVKLLQQKKQSQLVSQEKKDLLNSKLMVHEDNDLNCKFGGETYVLGRQMQLHNFIRDFDFTPQQFAENICHAGWGDHKCKKTSQSLLELGKEFVGSQFSSMEDVIQASKIIFAIQLSAEYTLRKHTRQAFLQGARISVNLTKQGAEVIDITHPLYSLASLKDVPISSWKGSDFLKLTLAEKDGLLTIDICNDFISRLAGTGKSSMKRQDCCRRKEFRSFGFDSFRFALEKILLPQQRQKVRAKLLNDCKAFILFECTSRLQERLWIGPPKIEIINAEVKRGLRIVSVAYQTDNDKNTNASSAFACYIGPGGETCDSDYICLENLTKYTNSKRESDRRDKSDCLLALKNFIKKTRPHALVVSGESRKTIIIQQDLRLVVRQLHSEDPTRFPIIPVDIGDMKVPEIYAKSQRGKLEFPDYPELLRQAISLGRLMQDPLIEFAQLWNPDYDILSYPYSNLQDQVPREELLQSLYLTFVSCATRVGIDLNRAVSNPRLYKLVQFISGLGQIRAVKLLKSLREVEVTEIDRNYCLKNRNQLKSVCQLGPKVYENCVGSIKIDTDAIEVAIGSSTGCEFPLEVLDGTRIHPSEYVWAKSMAIDAVGIENGDPEAEAGAVKRVLKEPQLLRDIDLDALIDALQAGGLGNLKFNFYEIRAELTNKYREIRRPYNPAPSEMFYMLTKETPDTFFRGKIVMFEVDEIICRKNRGLNIIRDELGVQDKKTGLWRCGVCWKDDFPDSSALRSHSDGGECAGRVIAISGKLEGHPLITGYMYIYDLFRADNKDGVETLKGTMVKKGERFPCIILDIQLNTFYAICSANSEELVSKSSKSLISA